MLSHAVRTDLGFYFYHVLLRKKPRHTFLSMPMPLRYGASATAVPRHFDHDIQALWEDVGVDQVGSSVCLHPPPSRQPPSSGRSSPRLSAVHVRPGVESPAFAGFGFSMS